MRKEDQSQREMRKKSLDELFEAKNVNQDLTLLKEAIINGRDLQPILEDYRQHFSNKNMRLTEDIINSDIVRNIYEKNGGQERERNPHEKQEGKEGQIDARRNQLDQMFAQKAQFKRDFADLKRALLENADTSQIMEFYEQQLGKKELSALKSLLQSKQFQDWKNVASRKQKREKLNKLFSHPDLKQDYGDLKEAILQRRDTSQLMQSFEEGLSRKQLKALKSILSSEEFKLLFYPDEVNVGQIEPTAQDRSVDERKSQIREAFKEIKRDVSELVEAVVRQQPYEEIIEKYEEEFSQREMKLLNGIIESQAFKKLLRGEEIDDQKERVRKINHLFSNKNIKSDISELISAIIARADLTQAMQQLEDKATAKEFRIIQGIVNSKQAIKLLTPGVREKRLKLDELFGHLKTDVQRLKEALLNREDVESLLTQYEEAMTMREFTQLMNILKSQDLAQILRNESEEKTGKGEAPNKWVNKQAKIRQFFQVRKLKSDIDILVRKLLAGEGIQMILQEYSDTMTASQFKILELALTSRQLQELLKDGQVDERQSKMDDLLKKYKITHDISELKSALLKGDETQSLIAKYKQDMKGAEFRELSAFLSSLELKKVLQNGNGDDKKRKLANLFKANGVAADLSKYIEAVLKNQETASIIQSLEQELSGGNFKAFKRVISSNQYKEVLGASPQIDEKRKLIEKLFEQHGFGSQLNPFKELILRNESTENIQKEYRENMTGKDFKRFQKLIDSEEFRRVVGQKPEKSLKDSVAQYFKSEGVVKDVKQLIQVLVKGQDIKKIMNQYQDEMVGGEFNKLNKAVESKQLQIILGKDSLLEDMESQFKMQLTQAQSQKWTLTERFFQQVGVKQKNSSIFDLKKAIVEQRQYKESLNRLKGKISEISYQNLQDLLKSSKFNNQMKKVEIGNWKEKFEELMSIIHGIQIKKIELVESLILKTDSSSILQQIWEKEDPQKIIEFNRSIQSEEYHQFFTKNNIAEPIIQKKHALYIRDKYYFINEGTPLAQIRIKYQISDDYKFLNLKDQFIAAEENFTESMKLIRCSEFSAVFQGETRQALLPYNIKLNDAKPIIRKILNVNLEFNILIFRDEKFIQQNGDFVLQTCSSKRLLISYFVNLIVTLNEESKDRQFKVMSHKSVTQLKEDIASKIGVKKQAQRWYIDNKEVLNNKETLQKLGIKSEYFRITIIQFKSLEYYGFTKQIEIKRSHFKDFFIEDDQIFCENITKSKFPADEYSEVFRNQILGYIFAAIKKHSNIDSSLNHIRSLVQSTQKKQPLWKPPSLRQKLYFNETFALYYILRCSEKSLRIDILRGVIGNSPVPLVYYNQKGEYVELMEENYWIQNKAFNIVSFGLGEVMGKSDLLNIIFETSFKNRDRMHKQCQGGIEVQYDIYKSDEYSVNLIDISNDISEDVKLSLARASNLVIIQTKKEEEEVKSWINEQKFDVPIFVIFRDVEDAFQIDKAHYRAQLKKSNRDNSNLNIVQIIPNPLDGISFYDTQINELADGVQQFVRKNYQRSTVESLWKFTDFLTKRTNEQYVKFNEILKDIESSKENLTKISNYFQSYKIIESEIDKDKQEQNVRNMNLIQEKALRQGLADPLKRIISFYRKNFTLSSQIMCKIRIFLSLLRNQLFREFNHLEDLLRDAGKKKEGNDFQAAKSLIVDKLKAIKELKDSLTTPEVKNQIENFISKAVGFKSAKDQEWQKIIKIIKKQFEFQIQPKAFSVQNFWREVIYMSKFDPNYEFKVDDETIRLTDAIINLGRKEVQDSQNFEVINGDLLEMPTEYLHRIFEHQQNKKVMVVAIFGPQSSGKSTLLNFVLGCDFMSSAGRCTKGIYGTYFQISNRQMPNCESILVLDTEGLFSNYENKRFKNRTGFDNKLVLFCLQVCDLVILNTKGDVTKECQSILEAAYDSEILDANNLPELYFVLNANGGEINPTQSNQVEKLCSAIITANPKSAKFVCKDRAVGMPMAFNQIPRRSTAQFITKYLKPKTIPSQRFYKQTKNLCYNIMELLTERGRERQGRTLQQVFVKMDQTWSTINKYPILTKHGNKKIKELEEEINLWKKDTKQHFINLQADFETDLKKRQLSQIEAWGQQKQKILIKEIQKAVTQFQNKFPAIPGELAMNTCITIASMDIEPTLNNSLQVLKNLVYAKRYQEQIQQSQKKGFDEINFALKNIKQAQAKSKQKVQISEEQKVKQFEQCWAKREAQMKKKLDRGVLAQESYQTIRQMYNGQLQLDKRSSVKIQIPPHYLKDQYKLDMEKFREILIIKFNQQMKNKKIFVSSNKAPVMNIEKRTGDLKFKYLDMSKYFQNRSKPTFIKIDPYELRNSLDWDKINKEIQDGLMKQNLNNQFANDLYEDFRKLGVILQKQKIQEVTEYQVSNVAYRLFSSTKQLSKNNITDFLIEQKEHIYKKDKKTIREKVKIRTFNRISSYFIKSNAQLNEQQQIEKSKLISEFKFLNEIPNFEGQFKKLIQSQQKTIHQQDTSRLIVLRLAKLAINYYARSLDKSRTDVKKRQLQKNIISRIAMDLSSINLSLNCPSNLDRKDKIQFSPLEDSYQFEGLESFKTLLSKFSKYWQNQNLIKACSCKQEYQSLSKWEITVGFFKRKEISVKEQYANRPILQKYINKEYNEFLNQMRKSNFTEFIKQELKYDSVFDDIYSFAKKQKLQEWDLNQAIQKIRTYTNELVQDIKNDLKQVSQTVIYDFIAELHFFSCHLLWKMKEINEWLKKQKIIASFNQKKPEELNRFLNLASGKPLLQNQACAEAVKQFYIQQLNRVIKADRQNNMQLEKANFKKTHTREYVQIQIDKELNDTSKPKNERQDRIFRYLLTPVDYYKQKYEECYAVAVNNLKNYKYTKTTKLVQDLFNSVIEFRDKTDKQQFSITDEIFEGAINETKEIYFIPLFVEVLNKTHDAYVDSKNKIGLKIKDGKRFAIQKIISQTENRDFLETLKNKKIMITNLKIFLDCLADKLELLKNSGQGINVDYTPQEINQFKFGLAAKICNQMCPCCRRNCDVDQESNPNHTKHKCNYGHQMRAVRGMRIESRENNKVEYKASIQRCQDLQNYSRFEFNGKDYTWQQFKLEKANQWDFNFSVKTNSESQFSMYWSIVGRKICDYYTQLDGQAMDFMQYNTQNITKLSQPTSTTTPTNYIFALDQSGSMSGNPWNQLILAMRSNIGAISAQNGLKNQYLSIFKFNDYVTPVCEFVAPESFNAAQIVFGNGGTTFTPAFRLARQIIERHQNVDNVFVFISDGEAEYPASEIPRIQQLQAQAKSSGRKVDYVSILIGTGGSIMEAIRNQLNGRHNTVTNSANVSSIFKEILKSKQS